MQRVGVDIVEIGRIDEAFGRFGQRFLDRVYTLPEIALCKGRTRSLAVRFAGKEAVMKALGTGVKGVSWREIEILALPTGEPVVRLYGKADSTAKRMRLGRLAISLSHSREYAVAVVVAQAEAADS